MWRLCLLLCAHLVLVIASRCTSSVTGQTYECKSGAAVAGQQWMCYDQWNSKSNCVVDCPLRCSASASSCQSNVCTCYSGFTGSGCQYSRAVTCNGHCNPSATGNTFTGCIAEGNWNAATNCSTCLAGFFGASCECSAATCSNTNMVPACTSSGQCICDAQHQGDAYCGSCTANYYSSIAGSGACNKYCLSSTTCNSVGSCTSTGSCQCNTGYSGPNCASCATGYSRSSSTGPCVACPGLCCDVPSLSDASPSSGKAIGGTKVTITGSGFCQTYGVLFNRALGIYFQLNSNSITVYSPPGVGSSLPLTLLSFNGNRTYTNTWDYKPPTITSVGPLALSAAANAVTMVTMIGSNFGTDVTQISLLLSGPSTGNSVASTALSTFTPVSVNDSTIIFGMRSSAGSYQIGVNVAGQSVMFASNLIYTAPVLTSVTPNSNLAAIGGSLITVQGVFPSVIGTATWNAPLVNISCSLLSVAVLVSSCSVSPNPSSTQVVCMLPPGSGSCNLIVTTASQSSNTITIAYLSPVITSILPVIGVPTLGGGLFTISGSNFGPLKPLVYSGDSQHSVVSFTDSSIIANSSAGDLNARLLVRSAMGANSTSFLFLNRTAPTISSVTPQTLSLASSPRLLTCNGQNFGSSGQSVTLNGVVSLTTTVVSVSPNQQLIVVSVPAGEGANFDVLVTVAGRFGFLSSAVSFATPVLTSVVPTSNLLTGTLITLSGSEFGPTALAFVGNSSCPIVTQSNTQIICTVPLGAGSNQAVFVQQAVNTVRSNILFVASFAAPTLSAITPSTGNTMLSGSLITLTGSQFGLAPIISFDLTNYSAMSVTATSLILAAPNGQGVASVYVIAGGQVSNALVFTFNKPSISSVSPSSGSACGGWLSTLVGSNFGGSVAPTVTFSGSACVLQSWNNSVLVCSAPARQSGAIAAISIVVTQAQVSPGIAQQTTFTGAAMYSGIAISGVVAASCTASMFGSIPSVTSCPVTGGFALTINGAGLLGNSFDSYKINNIACVVQSSTCSTVICSAPPASNPAAPAVLSLTAFGGSEVAIVNNLVSYVVPTISSIQIGAVVGNQTVISTAGGSTLTVIGSNFGAVSASVTVTYGPSGNPSMYTCSSVNLLSSTSLTCAISSGVGQLYRVTVNVAGISSTRSSEFLSYAAPTLVSGSLRLASSSLGSTSLVGTSSKGDIVAFNGTNFGSSASQLSVYYGTAANLYEYLCSITSISTNTISCATAAAGANLNSLVFTVVAPALSASGTIAYPESTLIVTSSDTFSYPSLPAVTQVQGCTDGVSATTMCPPNGNGPSGSRIVLTVSGARFGTNPVVSVDGIGCDSVQILVANTQLTCLLPVGSGLSRSVQVSSNGGTLTSPVNQLISYATPTITAVSGCTPSSTHPSSTSSCSRTAQPLLTISGVNFGTNALTVQVFVGSVLCPVQSHVHTQIVCMLAQNVGTSLPVQIVLPNFAIATGDSSVSVSYAICAAGTYSTGLSCSACIAGSYSLSGASACSACPTGTFNEINGSSTCTACAAGKYNSVTGATSCLPCDQIYFSSSSGATACSMCFVGSFSNSTAQSSCLLCGAGYSQSQAGQSACTLCSIGLYSSSLGQTACALCPDGTVSQAGSSSCQTCVAGFYSVANNPAGACSPCSVGTFAPQSGMHLCVSCFQGTFSNTSGSSACVKCASGSYASDSGSSSCAQCPSGSVTNAPGQSICQTCPSGSFSASAGQSMCTSCPAGQFSAVPGFASCTPCSAGTWASTTGATACQSCNVGTFSASTASISCVSCPPGTFSNQDGSSACTNCTIGTFSANFGSAICQFAPSGSFVNLSGMSAVSTCSSGSFSSSVGSTSCATCPSGSFSAVDAATACTTCPPGYFQSEGGQTSCKACIASTHSKIDGATTCTVCELSQYSNVSASSSCFTCSIGTSSTAGSSSCTSCSPGQYGVILNSVPQCLSCGTGSYSTIGGSTICTSCPLGSFANLVGMSSCLPCEPGSYAASSAAALCTSCERGSFQNLVGATACFLCAQGTYANTQNSSSCLACAPATYAQNLGSIACVPSTKGYFVPSSKSFFPIACSAGSVSPADSGSTSCLVCDAGYFANQPGMATCTSCPSGTFTNLTASPACTFCPVGQYASALSSTTCLSCPIGQYTPVSGLAGCLACSSGQYSTSTGRSTCDDCPAGTFSNAAALSMCASCPAGTYSSSGSSVCTSCPTGTFSDVKAPFCLSCPSGSTSDVFGMACACKAGFYLTCPNDANSTNTTGISVGCSCLQCPLGANCLTPGKMKSALEPLPGWWLSNVSGDFYKCLNARSCLGVGNQCAANTQGPLCAQCVPGSYLTTSRSCVPCPSVEQTWTNSVLVALGALLFVMLQLYLVLRSSRHLSLIETLRQQSDRSLEDRFEDYRTALEEEGLIDENALSNTALMPSQHIPPPDFGHKLKIIIGFAQVCTNVSASVLIAWPPTFQSFISYFDATNADYISASSIECVMTVSFFSRFLTVGIVPVSLALLVAVGMNFSEIRLYVKYACLYYCCSRNRKENARREAHGLGEVQLVNLPETIVPLPESDAVEPKPTENVQLTGDSQQVEAFMLISRMANADMNGVTLTSTEKTVAADDINVNSLRAWRMSLFLITFLISSVSSTVLRLYQCTSVDGVDYLTSDFRVLCTDESYLWYARSIGVFFVVLYPIGIPLFLFVLLYRHRHVLRDERTHMKLGILYSGFHPSIYWFDICDVIHRVIMCATLPFLPRAFRLPFALSIQALYLGLILVASPYIRKGDDRLQLLAQTEIMLLILVGYIDDVNPDLTTFNDMSVSLMMILMASFLLAYFVVAFANVLWKKFQLYRRSGIRQGIRAFARHIADPLVFKQTSDNDAERISVSIPTAATDGDAEAPVTRYSVHVIRVQAELSAQADTNWIVSHRYTDFVSLHQNLLNEGIKSLPKIPPRVWFGSLDPDFIEQRRQQLEEYLRQISNMLSVTKLKVWTDFLKLGEHKLQSKPKQARQISSIPLVSMSSADTKVDDSDDDDVVLPTQTQLRYRNHGSVYRAKSFQSAAASNIGVSDAISGSKVSDLTPLAVNEPEADWHSDAESMPLPGYRSSRTRQSITVEFVAPTNSNPLFTAPALAEMVVEHNVDVAVLDAIDTAPSTSRPCEVSNSSTKESSKFPDDIALLPAVIDQQPSDQPEVWTEYTTDEGVPYFVSSLTGESCWHRP